VLLALFAVSTKQQQISVAIREALLRADFVITRLI